MKRFAWLLLGLAVGCSRSNPWDTRGDAAALEAERREDLRRDVIVPYDPPQQPEARPAEADLEGWRDTVLASADDETLKNIRVWTTHKIGELEARIADLMRQDEHSRKAALATTQDQWRREKARLAMVEDRIKSGRPRRAE